MAEGRIKKREKQIVELAKALASQKYQQCHDEE